MGVVRDGRVGVYSWVRLGCWVEVFEVSLGRRNGCVGGWVGLEEGMFWGRKKGVDRV